MKRLIAFLALFLPLALMADNLNTNGPYVDMPGINNNSVPTYNLSGVFNGVFKGSAGNGSQYWVSNNLFGAVGGQTFTAAGPGDAVQGCLNLVYTNGQVWSAGSSSGVLATTNLLGGRIHIYPYGQLPCIYYRPAGYTITNAWAWSGIKIEGDGPLSTVLAGDSNVLTFQHVSQDTFAEIQDMGFAWSNYQARAIACDLVNAQPLHIQDCLFNWLGNFTYTNALNIGGGSTPTMAQPNDVADGAAIGIVALAVGGGNDSTVVGPSVYIAGAACGILVEEEHDLLTDVRFPGGGGIFNGATTNAWSTNDISRPFAGYNVHACDLALGAAILIDDYPDPNPSGSDDVQINHVKVQGWPTGIVLKEGMSTGPTTHYGYPQIQDAHFEAMSTTPPHDVVLDFATNSFHFGTYTINAEARDLFDQQTANFDALVWEFNGTNFLLTTNFFTYAGFGPAMFWEEGVHWNGTWHQWQWHSNNIVIHP